MGTRPSDSLARKAVPALAALAIISAILLSAPVLLAWLGSTRADWQQIAGVSTTYAAVAALVNALAVFTLAISLFLQGRQARHDRKFALREAHVALITMALQEPTFFKSWGGAWLEQADDRLVAYTNLVISFWELRWDLGEMTVEHCRDTAKSFFASELARLYWAAYGRGRAGAAPRNRRPFYQIFNDEFADGVAGSAPTRPLLDATA